MKKLRTRKRGSTWSYVFDAGVVNGKRKRVEKGGFPSQKDAYDAGVKALASYNSGNIAIVSEKVSVKSFVNAWLDVKSQELRPTSLAGYRAHLDTALDIIGGIQLQKLRPRDIDCMIRQIAAQGKAHNTVHTVLKRLRDALNYAVYPAELLQVNPATFVKLPSNLPRNVVPRQVITPAKLAELIAAAPFGTPFHVPILIAYHTGMRLGEVLGLCWDAVDVKRKRIAVVRQLCYTGSKGNYIAAPKTATSVRNILIDDRLTALLKRWKKEQARNELTAGQGYHYAYTDGDGGLWEFSKSTAAPPEYIRRELVCTVPNGKIVCRSVLSAYMKKHGTNFHSLRHTHATVLIENNAIAKDVAARLGHADATITQNLYTHDTAAMQENTLAIFEKTLQNLKMATNTATN